MTRTKNVLITLLIIAGYFLSCYGAGVFEAHGTEDVTGPALTSWSLSPLTVSTSSGPQTVTATMAITDGLTGLGRGIVCLGSPSSNQVQYVSFSAAQRTSGTANNGTYAVTATLPQYSNTGLWTIRWVELIDAIGNSRVTRAGDPVFSGYPAVTAE